ncbi:hypothetical protein, unlikely [Trypanosoma brucei gambiense DAL972]|uniref:Uncharacterized protein n=1 Tax=Trypanosoma brucei gambiense (strain MHOM/CI/86/DAL972) TaxID=679716 RepID=D0AAQ3_TRYB9|nr:hypothetical protein, unlikely [Trypanosoma brucei gambiense DAL972]CBH18754.1 hypothetical protein, unlikely [Trypanosoma brucei gambiense DAL972]|eukprot:XP_011781018.1 hypothetical protein, unlikely [Trypanosoma brucei gambiense DAL972]
MVITITARAFIGEKNLSWSMQPMEPYSIPSRTRNEMMQRERDEKEGKRKKNNNEQSVHRRKMMGKEEIEEPLHPCDTGKDARPFLLLNNATEIQPAACNEYTGTGCKGRLQR